VRKPHRSSGGRRSNPLIAQLYIRSSSIKLSFSSRFFTIYFLDISILFDIIWSIYNIIYTRRITTYTYLCLFFFLSTLTAARDLCVAVVSHTICGHLCHVMGGVARPAGKNIALMFLF